MCVCVFFKVFLSLFFSFFGLEPLGFPLCRQFIYVHYFRLPDFYSPLGVSSETRESRSTMSFGHPIAIILHCAYYVSHPLHYTHYTYLSSMYWREKEYSTFQLQHVFTTTARLYQIRFRPPHGTYLTLKYLFLLYH